MKKPGEITLLPQYYQSDYMYERFLDAALVEADEISRTGRKPGIKKVEEDESDFDNYNYFLDNKSDLEKEFSKELNRRIGPYKSRKFQKIISESWYDGRLARTNKDVNSLMKSVENYFIECRIVKNPETIRVQNYIQGFKPNFHEDEIRAILELNRELLDHHLQKWIDTHPKSIERNTEGIYCRRGITLDNTFSFNDFDEYLEYNFINSYSFSFSVPEQFTETNTKPVKALLNINYAEVRDRILFFSPFIKKMPPLQLELGVIPHYYPLTMIYQGQHGGIHEYMLEYNNM